MSVTLNPKYQNLLQQEDVRYFIVTGGRGSGKSYGVNTVEALRTFTHNSRTLFTRYTMRSAAISIIPEFLEKIEALDSIEHFHVTKDQITNKLSGGSILFRGIKTSSGDQTAALKSLQGISTFIIDEAEELTDEETFDKIDLSVREKGIQNRVVLIMNPATKEHWIYQRFFEAAGVEPGFNGVKGNVCYIHTTYLDNAQNLSESYLNQIEEIKKRRPEKYKYQILGGWRNKAEGVIFNNWEVGKWRPRGEVVYGMDFGYSIDPTTLVATYIDSKRKQIYLKLLLYKPHLTTSDIYDIASTKVGKGIVVADSAEPRLISELKARGMNMQPAKKGPDSIKGGIAQLLDYDLIVDEDSVDLIKELNNYCWLSKGDKPVDNYNHAIDAVRYAVSFQIDDPNKGSYAII
jgi:phage terminase large subunit